MKKTLFFVFLIFITMGMQAQTRRRSSSHSHHSSQTTTRISVPTIVCDECDGTGKITCPNCDGEGVYETYDNEYTCKRCGGSGYALAGGGGNRRGKGTIRCPECKGKGRRAMNASECNSKGCELAEQEEYKEAFRYFKLAAEGGDTYGMYNLGNKYYYGEGVTKNIEEAIKWYKKAADQGDADGYNMLAYIYAEEKKDSLSALQYINKAIEISDYSDKGFYMDSKGEIALMFNMQDLANEMWRLIKSSYSSYISEQLAKGDKCSVFVKEMSKRDKH